MFKIGTSILAIGAAVAVVLLTAGCDQLTTEGDNFTLTVNYDIPSDELDYLLGETWRISIWEDIGDELPLFEIAGVVQNGSGTATFEEVPTGIYHITVTIGDEEGDDDGFLAWGGIDIAISADRSISIQEHWWQWVESIAIGVRGIPDGNDGELIVYGLFADGGNLMDFHDRENFIMGGAGVVYGNTALIAMHPIDEDSTFELADGTYDLIILVDHDGTPEDYDHIDLDTIEIFMPYDIGEPYWISDYVYDANAEGNEVQVLDGDFSDMIGITGAVDCSQWVSGTGDIYLVSFEENPFDPGEETPYSLIAIEQPGEYALPVFPGFSGYLAGVWDANGNGLEGEAEDEGGPDEGDYLGIYGTLETPEVITCENSTLTEIDFAIDIPFNDTLLGGE